MAVHDRMLSAWHSGKSPAVLVFHGEEEFLRSELLHEAPALLVPDEATRSFNFDLLYGPETSIDQVITLARSYPMMAERRVVIVREADRILRAKPAGTKSKKASTGDLLQEYLDHPNPDCVLIFDLEKFGARNQSPFKELAAKADVIEFFILKESEVVEWVRERAKAMGKKLPADAARLMVAHLGTALHAHANELDKLVTYTADKSEITTKDVEQVVGVSHEHNVFELTKAIGAGNKAQTITIAMHLLDAGKDQRQFLFVMLSRFIEQLMVAREMSARGDAERAIAEALELRGGAAYFVKEIVQQARRYTRERLDHALAAIVRSEASTRRAGQSNDELLMEQLILSLMPG
jgi:DNA polymerase-3 subunit delta